MRRKTEKSHSQNTDEKYFLKKIADIIFTDFASVSDFFYRGLHTQILTEREFSGKHKVLQIDKVRYVVSACVFVLKQEGFRRERFSIE